METTLTSAQMQSFLRLLDDKRVTPERFTRVLASGILSDLFDEFAKYDKRTEIMIALGLYKSPAEIVAPIVRGAIPSWRTLKRKRYVHENLRTFYAYNRALHKKDMNLGKTAHDLLMAYADWEEGPDELDIAKIYLRHLGIDPGQFKSHDLHFESKLCSIAERATELGLKKLPLWAIAQLQEEYDDQPSGSVLNVIAERVVTDRHVNPTTVPYLFVISRVGRGKRWLDATFCEHVSARFPEAPFAYVLPRK
jgi:hypothetical protein